MKKLLCIFFITFLCFSTISCGANDPISETIARIEDQSVENGIIPFSNDVSQLLGKTKEQLQFNGEGYEYFAVDPIESYTKNLTAFNEQYALQLIFYNNQLKSVYLLSTMTATLLSVPDFSSVLSVLEEEYDHLSSGVFQLGNNLYLEAYKEEHEIRFAYTTNPN